MEIYDMEVALSEVVESVIEDLEDAAVQNML
jgi:hypothetical protein